MKVPNKAIAFSLSCLFSIYMPLAFAQVSKSQQQAQKKTSRAQKWDSMWRWTTASWDSNDIPYEQIRTTIDQAVASGQKPEYLTEFYAKPARRAPNDSIAQFRWAYAAYTAAKEKDYTTGEKILDNPLVALTNAPFPHSYQYARLIYLALTYASYSVPFLQEVSKRMVRRNPGDTDVKYAVARNLIYSTNSADRALAYSYIHELIAARPEWASPHGLLGFVYYKRWQTTKNKADADTAIAEYKQYIQLAAVNDPFNPRARQTIAEIQKG